MTAGEGVGGVVDRVSVVADLSACRDDLHHLLATATPTRLRARTNGTRWSNEQLLFHMVFGFLVVRRLLPLVRLVSGLPPWVGRSFARALDFGPGPFQGELRRLGRWSTLVQPCSDGPVVRSHHRPPGRHPGAGARTAAGEGDAVPDQLGPYFEPFMTLADAYGYPGCITHITALSSPSATDRCAAELSLQSPFRFDPRYF